MKLELCYVGCNFSLRKAEMLIFILDGQGGKRIIMAEGETKALSYIPEVILKKRKHKEESLALTRKTQLEFGKYGGKKKKVEDIKRPEHFIKEFRDKVSSQMVWFSLISIEYSVPLMEFCAHSLCFSWNSLFNAY